MFWGRACSEGSVNHDDQDALTADREGTKDAYVKQKLELSPEPNQIGKMVSKNASSNQNSGRLT